MGVGWPRSWSGRFGKKENSLPLPDDPGRSLGAIPTTQSTQKGVDKCGPTISSWGTTYGIIPLIRIKWGGEPSDEQKIRIIGFLFENGLR